jgi:hypothetical protein
VLESHATELEAHTNSLIEHTAALPVLRERCGELTAELKITQGVVLGHTGSLVSVNDSLDKKADTDRVLAQIKDVRGYVDVSVAKVEDQLVQAKDGWKETLRGYSAGVMAELKATVGGIAELREQVFAAVGAEGVERSNGLAAVTESVGNLARNFLEVESRMVGSIDSLNERTTAGHSETRAQCASLFDKAERSAAMLVQETAGAIREDLEALGRTVEGLPTPEAVAAVETRAMARLGGLADDLAALRDAAPPAVDLSPVEDKLVDLSARVDGVVRSLGELPVPTLEAPQITVDSEYRDGAVHITLAAGEHKSTTAVPVSIGVQYRGIYKADADTKPGDLFTHKGSIWFCKSPAAGEPGKDFTGWQLAVKAGANGKDGHSVQVYERHAEKNVYKEGDFLRINNRLWQCAVDKPNAVPEPGDISTTPEWVLIAGAI